MVVVVLHLSVGDHLIIKAEPKTLFSCFGNVNASEKVTYISLAD